jgi:hypothetical protein
MIIVIYCQVFGFVTIDWVYIYVNRFIEHLYTPLGTTITEPLLTSTIHTSPQQPLSLFQPVASSTTVP